MADDNNQSSAFGRFQSRQAGGEQASAEKPKRATEPPIFNPKDLTQVAGIVGRLKDWIGGACLHPNPKFDVGAALAIVGNLMSQRVAAPEHGSTHLYAVAIGGSASGKQLRLDAVKEAFTAIGASDRLGPDDFRSSVGVINQLKRHSCFCAPIDEYGGMLQRICNKGAGGYEQDIINVLQKLWGLNWAFFNTPVAAREKSKKIFAPAFTIFGVSVPELFFGSIRSKQITSGLLNRHLIFRGDDEAETRERVEGAWKLPLELGKELKAFYKPRFSFDEIMKTPIDEIKPPDEQEDQDDEPFDPEITMPWGNDGAKQVWVELIKEVRKERDELRRNLFARVPEQTIRIASIIAFGRYSPTVGQLDMELARAWTLESGEELHKGILKYGADAQDFPGLCQKIESFMPPDGSRISRRDINRKCRHLLNDPRELDRALGFLVQAEVIRVDNLASGPKGGAPSAGYALWKGFVS